MYVKKGEYYNTKKLKKYRFEQDRLDIIINHIESVKDFKDLILNPISIMYGIERLKYELNEYYSFNLCKSRSGVIRMIFRPTRDNTICLEYISFNHYDDFKGVIK